MAWRGVACQRLHGTQNVQPFLRELTWSSNLWGGSAHFAKIQAESVSGWSSDSLATASEEDEQEVTEGLAATAAERISMDACRNGCSSRQFFFFFFLSEPGFIFTPRIEKQTNKQTFPFFDCLALTKSCQNQSEPSHQTATSSLLTILIVFPQCDGQTNIINICLFPLSPSPEWAVSCSGSPLRNDLVTGTLHVKPLRVDSRSHFYSWDMTGPGTEASAGQYTCSYCIQVFIFFSIKYICHTPQYWSTVVHGQAMKF